MSSKYTIYQLEHLKRKLATIIIEYAWRVTRNFYTNPDEALKTVMDSYYFVWLYGAISSILEEVRRGTLSLEEEDEEHD